MLCKNCKHCTLFSAVSGYCNLEQKHLHYLSECSKGEAGKRAENVKVLKH